MTTPKKNPKKQFILIVVILAITALLASYLIFSSSNQTAETGNHAEEEGHAENDAHAEAGAQARSDQSEHAATEAAKYTIALTQAQIASQGIRIETATTGSLQRRVSLPGRLLVNADQQAHISPNFAGRVEAVYVQTGQYVKKGQVLATLLVPELVDLQANIRLMQSRLDLAASDYRREKSLWQQGISAKQDYLLAENQYKQAQIEVSAAKARINAYGAPSQGSGRFDLKSPISGVVNSKDVVVGENVQTATPLFLIDRLDQLWLEFVLTAELADSMAQRFNQQAMVGFSTSTGSQTYRAQLMSLTPSADLQTGRLVARAVVDNGTMQLRPNMLVTVEVTQASGNQQPMVLVKRSAIQQFEGRDVVFVVEKNKDGAHFSPRPVTLGQQSPDREQIAILTGLRQGQVYVSMGSFTLKSELEKGEAEHGH